ncbi:MAG: asparaginase [Candidatus Cloacimonetes bacterium]|nr:asparaginase [Candidatus Cloacimonadota bacterium]
MKKKILIITTGGTIAMKYLPDRGLVPTSDLVDFLHSFPQLSNVANVEVFEFSNVPSPFMTPQKMLELARVVDLRIVDFDGIVITHGTDTLEETSYMLDLVLTTRKPVVFTAAMRSGSDLGLDGPRNIVGAVRVASHAESIDKGVLVVMNDEILTAVDVLKYHTGKIESFDSPEYGIIGIVDPDEVIFHWQINRRDHVWTDRIDTRVDLLRAVAGMDGRFIEAAVAGGARAIVIEAFGRGNLPPDVIPAIEAALNAGVLVVVVSRAYTGRVLPEYGYEGGGMMLQQMGCILGGNAKGHKARIKLMCLFGKYDDAELVRKFYLNSLR